MAIFRKSLILAVLVLGLLIAITSVSAATSHQIVRETVNWTIPADQCPALPAGVSVSGTGQRHQVINTRVNADGSSEVVVNDVVKGTAVDSNGGTYHFIYTNHSITSTPASGSPIAVSMSDNFVLNGAVHMTVGFNWRWTFTPPAEMWPPNDNWVQVNTRGEPFLCDPI